MIAFNDNSVGFAAKCFFPLQELVKVDTLVGLA